MPDPAISKLFERAAKELLAEHRSIGHGRMFASNGLRTSDKYFGFVGKTALIVKLPADRVAELIDAGDGQPCDIRGGRPMKEWVCLRPTTAARCKAYLFEAFTFVASEQKSARKKK